MEDMEDDFGDLYADVEVQVSSAFKEVKVPSFNNNQLYIKQGNEKGNGEGDFDYDSNLNKVEKMIIDESKTMGMEGNDEKDLILDNGSDSEDDLHILLNEEDCRDYPVSHDVNVRNVGMVEGRGDGEDEDGDFVVGMEGDKSSKDAKRVEKLMSDGLEQSNAGQVGERGNGLKCSYSATQYSQYKYFRPHTTAFPSSTKPNGVGVGGMMGRSDWDLNGSIHSLGSQGRDFSLPRYRTIFDVNIDTFERKPWRHPGVDITKFFNFDLDEESWKHYCNCMEKFRQQATMQTKIPIRWTHQAYEGEFAHETEAPEVVAGDLIPQSGNRDVRLLEIPKGRAIQVEDGGIGERLPSMDIRRSRNRDSDVVIQIPVQDSGEFSPSSSREEHGYVDNSMVEGSENGGSDLDDNRDGNSMDVKDENSRRSDPKARCSEHTLCLDPDMQGHDQIDGCHYQKVRECTSKEVTEATETRKDAKEGINKNCVSARACASEAESSLGDQIQLSFSPSYLDSQSEASKAGDDIDLQDTRKLAKMPSMNSTTGFPELITSDSYHKKDSRIKESKRGRPVGLKDDYKNNTMQVEHNSRSITRLPSVGKLNIHSDDGEPSPLSDRKGCYDRNHLAKVYGTRRERKSNYDFNDEEDMSLHRETEISIGYRDGRFTKKQVRNAYAGILHRKGYPHFRDEVNPHLRRHRDERESFSRKRDAGRDNEVTERELYLSEKGNTNGGISGVTHDESMRSTSENSSFRRDEERYRWQTRKRNDEYGFRREIEVDDFVFEHRYKEEIYEENYGRHEPYAVRERNYYSHEKFDRDEPYDDQDIMRCDRRERYGGNACFDDYKSWNFGGRDDDCWRHSDHEPFSPYSHRESYISNERGYHDNTSPRNDLFDSRRSDGRTEDNWRHIHSEKYRDSSWFDPVFMDHEDADRTIYPDDHARADRRRYLRHSDLAMDNLSSRRQSRGKLYDDEEASFSCEMSLRHEYIHVKQDALRAEVLLDQNRLERDRYRMIREECWNAEVKDEQTALRFRDSVDLNLVGWEGKSSGRSFKVVAARGNGRNNNMDYEFRKEQRTFGHSDKPYTGKFGPHNFQKVESNFSNRINSKFERAGQSHLEHHTNRSNEKLLEKYPDSHHHEASVLEVRQQIKDPETNKRKIASQGDMNEKILNSEDSIEYDNQRILETLAKMEKRRERFKEAVALRKDADKNPMPQSDVEVEAVESAEVERQRPARKRRWGGN